MDMPVVTFQQFVLKVHSRCDLACDHCYIYHGHDDGWRDRPMVMTDETVRWAGRRIADHARTHLLDEVHVVLHGGEPLLAGVLRLAGIISTLRAEVAGVCGLDLRIHTNGVQLSEEFCDLFAAAGVKVGISLDGSQAANDLHRRYLDGRSSYNQVIQAINLLHQDRYRALYQGLLCTIDLRNDPIDVYESLAALEPPRIDFLLPHATWDDPPFRFSTAEAETAYADWLIKIFDRWSASSTKVSVRLFDSIIRTSHGSDSLTEAIGITPSNLVVIETDGAYEQADSLKASYEGASGTGFNVFSTDLDEVAGHPGIVARQGGLASLSATCRTCDVVSSCGGGLYAHRYRSDSGFANPSVYCSDLMKLVKHIRANPPHGRSVEPSDLHALAGDHYDELAAGYGKPDAIRHLQQAQYSLARALLVSLHDRAIAAALPDADQFDLPDAWKTLVGIDKVAPTAVEAVVCYPFFRV
ncbi:MAG TPA: FxsB family cyclophane-forming radical SAM/SPASM peptide maturase, partial [Streptosporangiaceae bacterium]|nr:FxsB family cyclophane-forming radical SAM/SPASM peptide maturase [Streptosporangiaceae bacterium]